MKNQPNMHGRIHFITLVTPSRLRLITTKSLVKAGSFLRQCGTLIMDLIYFDNEPNHGINAYFLGVTISLSIPKVISSSSWKLTMEWCLFRLLKSLMKTTKSFG
ncbi:hypothetical protein OK016_18940 [Vibrio chagasii]|nr:hypothetical protein [Vibrio chagasii]